MSGAPFPDPAHVCEGEPIVDIWTHDAIRLMPGATADEVAEYVLKGTGFTLAYDRRVIAERVHEIVAMAMPADDPWWTPWHLNRLEKYRESVRYLRRNDPPATVAAVARRMGNRPRRDTLARWIKDGRFERPEAVPDSDR